MKKVAIVGLFLEQNHHYKLLLEKTSNKKN